MLNDGCVCPGGELRLKCSVVEGVATVWNGTGFDCPGQHNQILLSHAGFAQGEARRWCNGGIIIGQSSNRTSDGNNSIFNSQLIVNLPLLNDTTNRLEGTTVQCVHDYTVRTVVGAHTIAYTRNGSHELNYCNIIAKNLTSNFMQLHLLIMFT